MKLNLKDLKNLKKNVEGQIEKIDIDYVLKHFSIDRFYYKVTYQNSSAITPINSGFSLLYYPREITLAIPNTLGIMCFEYLYDAELFVKNNCLNYFHFIRKVIPIGKKTIPKRIGFISDLNCFYLYFQSTSGPALATPAPKGTVCFPAVIVCEGVL